MGKAEVELNVQQPPGSPPIVEGLDLVINATSPQVWVEFSSAAAIPYPRFNQTVVVSH